MAPPRPHLRPFALYLGTVLVLVPAACAPKQVLVDDPFEVDATDYGRVFDATVRVLRAYGFHVDRHDYRFGVITTRPLSAPSVLEPWHRTHTSESLGSQSTLNHLRRVQVLLAFVCEYLSGRPRQ